VPHAARGLRRIELHTGTPEPVVEFYAQLLGWAVLPEPSEVFGGWVGDRLAVRVLPGSSGWRPVFAGTSARALSHGASLDQGRVLHGPWAPAPRPGEPSWVELVGAPEDFAAELGWQVRTPGEPFTLLDVDFDGAVRPVAGRLAEGPVPGWMPYFAVPAVAEAADAAQGLGGKVVMPPAKVPTGLVTSITDPAGNVATLLQSPAGWGGACAGT
jgi:hypothetical protein